MWIPPQTTVPPGASARSASGTSAPTGAKMIAASSGSGGGSSEEPAHTAPSSRAKSCASSSPGRVNAYTRRPCQRQIWIEDVRRVPRSRRGRARLRVAAHPQRPVADQPGAQQRRRLLAGVARGDAGSSSARRRPCTRRIPPSMSRPVNSAFGHRFSRPLVQYPHSPSVQPSHGTPTRRPPSASRESSLGRLAAATRPCRRSDVRGCAAAAGSRPRRRAGAGRCGTRRMRARAASS